MSQAELVGLQVSVTGLDTMGLTTELTVESMAVAEWGTGLKGQGLCVSGVAGGVIVTGQSAMLCWLSRYTKYSNIEPGLAWEKHKR